MSNQDRSDEQTVDEEFGDAVNMTAKEIDDWLDTDESRSVGQKSGNGESTGHVSGRRIVTILRTRKADLGDDVAHMRKVVGMSSGTWRSVRRATCGTPHGDTP